MQSDTVNIVCSMLDFSWNVLELDLRWTLKL